MLLLLLTLVVVVVVAIPSQDDYNVVYEMEKRGLVPYLTPFFPPFSNDRIRELGRRFLSAGQQNATALALCLYDWSQPHFIRIWLLQLFPTTPNSLAMAAFTHGAKGFFGVANTSSTDVFLKEFLADWEVIQHFSSEATLIEYGLSLLEVPQEVPLFMGVKADDLFCRQIGVMGNVSGATCLNKYFVAGTTITTSVFWSTTPDKSYASQYAEDGMFFVKPLAKKTRSRNITAFTIASQVGGTEHLYPAGTSFLIKNCTHFSKFVTCSMEELL